MLNKRFTSLLLAMAVAIALVAPACIQKKAPTPPLARTIPKSITIHGFAQQDNYFWLRNRENPNVIEYLEAENEYTNAMMSHTNGLQEKLYQEMVGRLKETDITVPENHGPYYYYTRTQQGKQYPIFCRKTGLVSGFEEIVLDENKVAEGSRFCSVDAKEISPNHLRLAYAVDRTGREVYTIYFKDLLADTLINDSIPGAYADIIWANDNQTIFYTTLDSALRPFQVHRHLIGRDFRKDEIVFSENDESFWTELYRSKSEQYLFIRSASETSAETYYLSANLPNDGFTSIAPRKASVEYEVEHNGGRFFIRTNEGALNFKIVTAPVKNPDHRNWGEFIPHSDSIYITDFDLFENYLVVQERLKGLEQIYIFNLIQDEHHYVTFDEPVYTISPMRNPEYKTESFRFKYSSLTAPSTVYDYHMGTRKRDLMKEDEVLGGYDKHNYVSERLYVEADDGALIPISLVHKKGLLKDSSNPVYLYGYGAYGISSDPHFSSKIYSLIDRGFVFAIAHIRGGGEMGRHWYDDGKLLKKRNSFTDFIACAEYLIGEKYTSSEKLVISGGSAGGLLIGVVVNMQPTLFKAAVADVPFVDVINTMLDPSIPLTVIEYEEWGNPQDKEYFEYMASYSPYDNVKRQEYPNMLITAGLYDPRVQYWEPAKWTAKLRRFNTGKNRLLLKTNMEQGHMGASGRYDAYRDIAFEYAFILDILGIKE